ncbi:diguanylate cyclase (GGDEF)-like protein/PAS domain S-box-containing protein [Methylohalomonas lacus]|uniref:Diguanylate cyclase (GGDEF)-like protein/PAS domain S-box-containing protein n=2 Tax=Methylohalomonas lacus TaxID=398773 RepID=A0AAE3HLL0_9GAMM|nr:diguanylate cyclase (GGDEF)-like protein/PAS domain S-box-containing protein [Methylohalomonas lacus]
MPVQRYRCSARKKDLNCAWEGNLRIQPVGKGKVFQYLPESIKKTPERIDWQLGELRNHVARSGTARHVPRVNEPSMRDFGDVSFEDMAQITLDAIGDAVLVVDPKGKVVYLNKVAETMTGWSSEAAIGRPVEEVFFIIDGTSRKRAASPSQRAINEGGIVELALGSILIRRDGTGIAIEDSAAPIPNRLGKVTGAVIVFHDARQSRTEMQKMHHLAQHDFLTGLPNRVLLMDRLAQAIGMAKRHHKQIALLFLDLDNFKQINDSFGHAAGDHLLQEVAADIVACVRMTDTVSRHGGDEFVIILTEIGEIQDSVQVAEKLLARFAQPRVIDGHELQITLSIGISLYPENGLDADTLIRNADTAMYATKESSPNSYQFFH